MTTTGAGGRGAPLPQPVGTNEQPTGRQVVVVIASPLDAELVARVAEIDARLNVRYEPDLLPPVRYPCDHRGSDTFRRSEQDEERWTTLLGDAEVLFGVPGDSAQGLASVAKTNTGLRWIQGTAAGVGETVRQAQLSEEALTRVAVTSAAGVHAGPLAEFALFGLLAFSRGLPRLLADTEARRWDHYPVSELAGRTLLVIGLGGIGREVARLGAAFGMRVLAINRTGDAGGAEVDEVHPTNALLDLVPRAHAVVVTLPLTNETEGLLDDAAITRMPAGAVVVNVGRGGVIDEPALIKALQEGRLAGAALDVFATEPLPRESPLWRLPNVLLSPHTAALSVRENERIVALFSENLRLYLRGDELVNRVDPTLYY